MILLAYPGSFHFEYSACLLIDQHSLIRRVPDPWQIHPIRSLVCRQIVG